MNRANIFRTAHVNARNAKAANGGDYAAYFAFYLREGYSAAKNTNIMKTHIIVDAEWTRQGNVRVEVAEINENGFRSIGGHKYFPKSVKSVEIEIADKSISDELDVKAAKKIIFAAMPHVAETNFDLL